MPQLVEGWVWEMYTILRTPKGRKEVSFRNSTPDYKSYLALPAVAAASTSSFTRERAGLTKVESSKNRIQ